MVPERDPDAVSAEPDPDAVPNEPDRDDPPPVRATYDRIADHFAETRANPWPEVESFLSNGAPGTVGLAVGCGNGRHVHPLAERVERVVGLDVSRALLEVAADEIHERVPDVEAGDEREPEARDEDRSNVHLVQADATALPLSADVVDVGLYVATVHHLRPRATRIRSLDELARVLAPGGRALVSAWSTEHDRFDAASGFDTTVDWTLPGGETVPRFYHIYDPAEFRADLDRSDLQVVEAFVSSGNCYAEVKG